MSGDQDLNSLSRFRKHSGRLVLEEHGHCEAPAGCGGVVMRWRNPHTAVPVMLQLYAPGESTCFIDGTETQLGQVDLSPGRHAVALALKDVNLSAGLILFAAVRRDKQSGQGPPPLAVEAPLHVLTADDGSWKAVVKEPSGEAWTTPAFDDSDWAIMTIATAPPLEAGMPGAWQYSSCTRLGAVCLGLPAVRGEHRSASWWRRMRPAPQPRPAIGNVWIRRVFEIPLPECREP